MHSGLPNANVATAAGSYAAFGGVLVGFSLAGLFWYLTQGRGEAKGPAAEEQVAERPSLRWRPADIGTRYVTLTVLYAMASLTMTSFLYGNLSGEVASQTSPGQGSPAWAVTVLVPYGVAFGLSVLMLFYGLTLVMLERSLAREAAWAYWIVACAGPAVVLRFLLTAGAEARHAICGCEPGGLLSTWGVFWIVLGFALLAAALMLLGLERRYTQWLPKYLGNRPAIPAVVVFALVSLMTALGSLYFTGRSSGDQPGIWSVYASLVVALGVVALFALACGCVIGPRVNVRGAPLVRDWLSRRRQRKQERERFQAGAARKPDYGIRNIRPREEAVFVICVPDRGPAGPYASPVLHMAFRMLAALGDDLFSRAVQIEPEWEILDDWLRPMVKLRLEFSGAVTGSASIVLSGRRHSDVWCRIADGGKAAITREWFAPASRCLLFHVDASKEIESLIAAHAWKSGAGKHAELEGRTTVR